MKRFILGLSAVLMLASTARAQLYVPGETLRYKMSYRAKLIPNTEVAKVVMQTTETTLDGIPVYKVYGFGQTAKAFNWILPVKDAYTVWVDPATLRTKRFDSDLHEGDYTFRSTFIFDWHNHNVHTRWQKRQNPEKFKTMKISDNSMDAISLYFNLRTVDDAEIKECIEMLMRTDAGTGFMHESFDVNDPEHFTREWFAWQNTLFGELILKIIADGRLEVLNSIDIK